MPIEPEARSAIAARLMADSWTQAVVEELHGHGLAELSAMEFAACNSSGPTTKTMYGACACVIGTILRSDQAGDEDLLLQTTLATSRVESTFGAVDLRWSVHRLEDPNEMLSTAVLRAGSLGVRFGTTEPYAVLMGHLQRAYLRDWIGNETLRRETLRMRVRLWLGSTTCRSGF